MVSTEFISFETSRDLEPWTAQLHGVGELQLTVDAFHRLVIELPRLVYMYVVARLLSPRRYTV